MHIRSCWKATFNMGNSFFCVYFQPSQITFQIAIEKARMLCLGFETRAAHWFTQLWRLPFTQPFCRSLLQSFEIITTNYLFLSLSPNRNDIISKKNSIQPEALSIVSHRRSSLECKHPSTRWTCGKGPPRLYPYWFKSLFKSFPFTLKVL